ncbi:NAD-dependent deacetylase sirtuin-5 [Echinococcus granulosus]|uniref:NAD-dependent protein deacylase n=1 Tax=Echinococcus granulosus TaxID=6210 RepID=W6USR0_ECHGR|nr:NAD-dependent deacetylase sirtuin-5 [Echinococcus granulosus]EUB64655.1 NAD-dependent deacetylase sirtuin-5 [Echinococcus granulosus]
MPSGDLVEFGKLVSKAKNLFVITGAGISAESGIPTFRGADGFWRKYSVTNLATREAFHYNPSLVWEFYHYRRELVSKKSPNAGHYAIRDLEKLFTTTGRSFTLATQNVDGFHFLAGNKNVIELHGSLFKVRCLECGIVVENRVNPICPALAGRGASDVSANSGAIAVKDLPHCGECGGLLRPHVVWFNEHLLPDDLRAAQAAAAAADVCLVVGTSSVVYPAAGLPISIAARGTPVAEVNVEPTPITPSVALNNKNIPPTQGFLTASACCRDTFAVEYRRNAVWVLNFFAETQGALQRSSFVPLLV